MGKAPKISEIKRIEQIAGCLFNYELHYLIEVLRIKTHLPLHKKLRMKKELPSLNQPEIIRKIFEELGGAFLKLGQVISLRPDLVGISFSKEFEKVLDQVPPEKFESIKEILIQNYPQGIHTFKEFDKIPIAAGSIAQVHKAVLPDGKKVAVKIQRPHVKEIFQQDIAIMHTFAERLKENPRLDFFDPVELVGEFRKYTLKELDFTHEAANLIRLRRNFKDISYVYIPRVYKQYSNEKILVMDLIEGESLAKIKKNLTTSQKKQVVEKVSTIIIKQIFEDGFFHADLHPGNIILLPRGKIGIIDCGITGYLDTELREKLFELFSGLVQGNLIKVTDSLIELNVGNDEVDREQLKAGVHYTLSDFYDMPMEKLPVGIVFRNAIDTALRSQLRMPANLVLLSKSLFTVDGFCRELCPSFNMIEHAKPLLKDLSKKEISPKKLAKDAIFTALEFKKLIARTPRYVEDFSRELRLIENRFTKTEQIMKENLDWIEKITTVIIFTLLLSPVLISSAILIHIQPLYLGISVFSLIGFVIFFYMFFLIIYTICKKKRR